MDVDNPSSPTRLMSVNFSPEDEDIPIPAMPPPTFRPLQFHDDGDDIDDDDDDDAVDADPPPPPNIETIQHIANKLLSIFVSRHAPRPGDLDGCATDECLNGGPLYVCNDCFTPYWYCATCMVQLHWNSAFHRIEEWSVRFKCTIPATLFSLGLSVSLLHQDGQRCRSRGNAMELNVLHCNGLHKLRYQQCLCHPTENQQPNASPSQLMANGLFPATFGRPSTAFTFQALQNFDVLNLFGHINIKQYCDNVMASTIGENTKTQVRKQSFQNKFPKTWFQASGTLRKNFHYSVCLWWLLCTMENQGCQSHQELMSVGSVDNCPACPHPQKNLPEGWENDPLKYVKVALD